MIHRKHARNLTSFSNFTCCKFHESVILLSIKCCDLDTRGSWNEPGPSNTDDCGFDQLKNFEFGRIAVINAGDEIINFVVRKNPAIIHSLFALEEEDFALEFRTGRCKISRSRNAQ